MIVVQIWGSFLETRTWKQEKNIEEKLKNTKDQCVILLIYISQKSEEVTWTKGNYHKNNKREVLRTEEGSYGQAGKTHPVFREQNKTKEPSKRTTSRYNILKFYYINIDKEITRKHLKKKHIINSKENQTGIKISHTKPKFFKPKHL